MTKAKIDYSKAKIYRIESINDQNSDIYIGSTTKQYLCQRFSNHKAKYRQWKKGAPRESHMTSYDIFEKYGVDNCQIVLIEAYPCTTVEELHRREGYFIKHIKCVNKNIAGNSHQESAKQYYQTHAKQIKQYYVNNKGELLLQMKQYYVNNKDELLLQMKQYRDTHAEQIKQLKKQSYTCDCGCTVTHGNIARHCKSKGHQQFIQTRDNQPNQPIALDIPDIAVVDVDILVN